ncbi:uncharacterized protein, partial [Temnothorax nylanderi]|uniref:uncharacterized protein n=1 Tax=Temnothorax nylanderi TaxID=102681 RepID=UPI003A8C3529
MPSPFHFLLSLLSLSLYLSFPPTYPHESSPLYCSLPFSSPPTPATSPPRLPASPIWSSRLLSVPPLPPLSPSPSPLTPPQIAPSLSPNSTPCLPISPSRPSQLRSFSLAHPRSFRPPPPTISSSQPLSRRNPPSSFCLHFAPFFLPFSPISLLSPQAPLSSPPSFYQSLSSPSTSSLLSPQAPLSSPPSSYQPLSSLSTTSLFSLYSSALFPSPFFTIGAIIPSFQFSGHPPPFHILLIYFHAQFSNSFPPRFQTSPGIPSLPIAFPSFNFFITLLISSRLISSSSSPSFTSLPPSLPNITSNIFGF